MVVTAFWKNLRYFDYPNLKELNKYYLYTNISFASDIHEQFWKEKKKVEVVEVEEWPRTLWQPWDYNKTDSLPKLPQGTIFAFISISCWGPWGWGCIGSWGCPRSVRPTWDHIKSDSYSKMQWKSPQRSIFTYTSLTCWGPWGWSCRGSWGCPRRLRPTWDHIKTVSYPKLHMQNG